MLNELTNSFNTQSILAATKNNFRILTDIKSFVRILDKKLKTLAQNLADPDADIDLGWIKFSAEEKRTNASALYFATSVYTTEIETSNKVVTSLRDKMFSIEKDVQKMFLGY